MIIPCEECICYPMCRNKIEVHCSKFIDYTRTFAKKHREDPIFVYWEKVNDVLPLVSYLREDDGSTRKDDE